MLITFYLEEETSNTQGYTKVATREVGQDSEGEEDEEEEEDDDDDEGERKSESGKGVELVESKKKSGNPGSPLSPLMPAHDSPFTIVSGRKSLPPSARYTVASVDSIGVIPEEDSKELLPKPLSLPNEPGSASDSASSSTKTSQQSSSSQATLQMMIKKVVFYGVGLTTTFSIWGIVQERMLTQPYDGVYFKYSYGLIFLNRLGGLLLSLSLMSYLKVSWVTSPLWEYSFPSVANMLSSWCQYEALKYVTFPTQTLSKAFKVVPVM